MWEDPTIWLGIIAGVVAVVTLGWKWAKGKWSWISKYPELLALAEGAVTETYHEYVRAIKERSADGTLTSEEKKQAMALAVAKFTAHAKANGMAAAQTVAMPIVKSLIEKAVTRLKAPKDT